MIGGLLNAFLQVKRGQEYEETASTVATTLDEMDLPAHEMSHWRHDLAKIYYVGGSYDRAQDASG